MSRSLIPRNGNDVVYTPSDLVTEIISEFPIKGNVLEPCYGGGAFLHQLETLPNVTAVVGCEIQEGIDFFEYTSKCDWVVTNPPWSLFKDFLMHSCEIADNIVFLVTINHFTTKARLKIIKEHGFYFRKIKCVNTPASWPQSGFQVAAIWISKEEGECEWKL